HLETIQSGDCAGPQPPPAEPTDQRPAGGLGRRSLAQPTAPHRTAQPEKAAQRLPVLNQAPRRIEGKIIACKQPQKSKGLTTCHSACRAQPRIFPASPLTTDRIFFDASSTMNSYHPAPKNRA